MNEEEALKRQVQKKRQVPERSWAYLKEMGHVQDALGKNFDEEAVRHFVEAFDDFAKASPVQGDGGSRGGSKWADTVEVSLSDLELERKVALQEYLAKSAACDADVYLFREKALEGKLLTKKQAWTLLRSPAAALLETILFKAWSIPIVGHTAEVNNYRREVFAQGIRHVASITVDPPGFTQEVLMPTRVSTSSSTDTQRPVILEFTDEVDGTTRVEVGSISLLGELRDLGETLSKRYGWQPAQAVWFVLTGEIPRVVALQITRTFRSSRYHQDALITIEASPWVSSKTVEKAFRKAQIETMETKGGRRPSKKNLRLFRFVTERIEPLGLLEEGTRPAGAPEHMPEDQLVADRWYEKIPKHRNLVREWNAAYPHWSYGTNTGGFWRAYNRVRETVRFGRRLPKRADTVQQPGRTT